MSLLNSMSAPSRQLSEVLTRAIEQAHLASNIIRDLREFCSKGDGPKKCLEIDGIINGLLKLLKSEEQESGVTIEFYPECRSCKVMVSKVQIDQVLINLVRNSIEAIKLAKTPNGRVVLQTRRFPNDTVEVTVADNGPGIDGEIIDMIFEPFQTNKETGMGIGLSLSRSIIEAHGGKLWLDKHYRNGALLGFALPVCQ